MASLLLAEILIKKFRPEVEGLLARWGLSAEDSKLIERGLFLEQVNSALVDKVKQAALYHDDSWVAG
jgi:hypothetical protein